MVGAPAIALLLLLLLEPPRAAGFPFPFGHHLRGPLLQPLRGGRGPLPLVKSGLRAVHSRPPSDPSERVRSPRLDAPPSMPCHAAPCLLRLPALSCRFRSPPRAASDRVTAPPLFVLRVQGDAPAAKAPKVASTSSTTYVQHLPSLPVSLASSNDGSTQVTREYLACALVFSLVLITSPPFASSLRPCVLSLSPPSPEIASLDRVGAALGNL